jgi:hypothetical protein
MMKQKETKGNKMIKKGEHCSADLHNLSFFRGDLSLSLSPVALSLKFSFLRCVPPLYIQNPQNVHYSESFYKYIPPSFITCSDNYAVSFRIRHGSILFYLFPFSKQGIGGGIYAAVGH